MLTGPKEREALADKSTGEIKAKLENVLSKLEALAGRGDEDFVSDDGLTHDHERSMPQNILEDDDPRNAYKYRGERQVPVTKYDSERGAIREVNNTAEQLRRRLTWLNTQRRNQTDPAKLSEIDAGIKDVVERAKKQNIDLGVYSDDELAALKKAMASSEKAPAAEEARRTRKLDSDLQRLIDDLTAGKHLRK